MDGCVDDGAAAVSGADGEEVWVAGTTIGGERGVIVGETNSGVNPPHARIGNINKIKSRFML
jgi:hypothetical protein